MTNNLEVSKYEKIDRLIATKILHSLYDYVNVEYKEYKYNEIDMCVTGSTFIACTLGTIHFIFFYKDINIYLISNSLKTNTSRILFSSLSSISNRAIRFTSASVK
ncbi:hypothetical protein EZS27_037393 [termite gut metagenome]|uniref:Uncharacterized protein n=1 Tax=termite gut metagenome TaxID=433724 RepID=A0A5J4PPN6_9ZZZZ